jgi:hypothetical protein
MSVAWNPDFESGPLRQSHPPNRSPRLYRRQKNTFLQKDLPARLGTTLLDRGHERSLFWSLSLKPGNCVDLVSSLAFEQNQLISSQRNPIKLESAIGLAMFRETSLACPGLVGRPASWVHTNPSEGGECAPSAAL